MECEHLCTGENISLIKSPEDEVHALVAYTNIFGIGYIEIEELLPGKNCKKCLRPRTLFGRIWSPALQPLLYGYMLSACTASYMDLVYGLPYPKVKGGGTFIANEVSCRSKGDSICRFIAELKGRE